LLFFIVFSIGFGQLNFSSFRFFFLFAAISFSNFTIIYIYIIKKLYFYNKNLLS
jgi:hypothetical protein